MARRLAPPMALALLAGAFCMWSQMTGFVWTDYGDEAAGPMALLLHGHLGGFLQTAPAYGGSLLLRSPFAVAASAAGGGEVAVYRMLAVPCLLSAMVLGIVLFERRRDAFPRPRCSLLVVLLAVGNPVTLRALSIGHPEELLGAVLCVGAVLCAQADRPLAAATLLGLAMANKAWAVLAIGPVLLALGSRRGLALAVSVGIAAAFTAPFLLAREGAGGQGVASLSHASTIFQPWQLWWPLGDLGHVVRGIDGQVKPGYRFPPGWLPAIAHPLIALLVVPASLVWRSRPSTRAGDVLLLLAWLLLARCVLDPWNIGYYHLPFLLALLAWEALTRERPPVLALVASVLVWLTFERLPAVLGPDAQCAAYLAWALPALVGLGWAAFRLPMPRLAEGMTPPVSVTLGKR